MQKLSELFGFDRIHKGDFGIEIEVEGKNLPAEISKYWNVVNDGSLRGESYEYVCERPLTLKEVVPALTLLKKEFENSELDFSFRTSVHVHVNVQNMTRIQLMNMVYTYFLLEEPLMTYCGRSRKGNRFCLRLQDAEGIMDTLLPIFSNKHNAIHDIVEERIRYSAINLAALRKFGSLEFRAMEGNIDVKRLSVWVEALHSLRKFAMMMPSPEAIRQHYQNVGSKSFLSDVLQDISPSFIYPNIDRDMSQSFSLSLDLPYAYAKTHKQEVVLPKEISSFKIQPAPIGIRRGDIIERGRMPVPQHDIDF